ncbi:MULTISPECIES: DUF389 domain-containing protein [Allobranchiibius]|uniref:Putative hydrophobic protein (TIGR00271 family) n=1 Tax=Allobranchiibius huperziae TaxID=1874116 RepID=A0A853DI45_9MICO|nr:MULTISPECIES: DUF389 domain-containing protein [Allobranchiibius]NYJ75639.1 putative hydrophobic protein (TIGR00271 family) [Allobranchiibius huperziae]UIJ36216.1 DUF389 domain-containing protein [Allobranchiibius sp. GilTou73]
MLMHLRLTVPDDLSASVAALLFEHPAATNLSRVRGASLRPPGDVIEVDVAREATSQVLDALRGTGLCDRGGVVLSQPSATPFRAAREIDLAVEGDPDDAVVWDVLLEQAQDAARPTLSYEIFLVIAVALASVAVITDSSILVVGAMVVGPEFATVAAICTGLALGGGRLALRSIAVLLGSFAFAVAVISLIAVLARFAGIVHPEMVARARPQTQFIWQPNTWSFVVALLAGAAGVLALSVEKAQAMVGVFISVTTVPAAGNFALALGLWVPHEMTGSAAQLGLNLVGMVAAGTLTLIVQRRAWHHVQRVVKPVLRAGRA